MAHCKDLNDVRAHIDRLDRQIVPLLAERATYVAQAPNFKATKHQVVDRDRIEEVISKVRHLANEEGCDPTLIENIYRAMIDAYIVFEAKVFLDVHPEK
ncbi:MULTISPECIES: chorismate mutase [Magnetospirillum]|uniref:chorismate mutase n=1 Tax=Magnetospirillum moscoviense TaxID=1437059 RepID=A0A178MVC8_9PROT|nr:MULTISPECIES: chorismate mutase [Magnetospirillum]MBF0324682.1 chorismate mutase [Alphaproteobacteria bacterium]OAN54266.1 chorismate mutase [Magnetospirillum moscoviense]CAA7616320.1 Salicylate biosynthesis protein pchB [Magnetospirillum sp. LM-5]